MDVGLSVDAIAASFSPRRTGSGTSSPRLPQGAFPNNRTHVLGPVGILRGRVGQGLFKHVNGTNHIRRCIQFAHTGSEERAQGL